MTEAQKIIVVATVEGDIHDIGKNIVSLMLGNHGFKVVDLGKDVKAEAIVEAAVAHKADLIGLSALMTTTMVRMRDTVDLVKQRGLGVDVMVGGAVVTPGIRGKASGAQLFVRCRGRRAARQEPHRGPARTSNPKEQPCAVFPA